MPLKPIDVTAHANSVILFPTAAPKEPEETSLTALLILVRSSITLGRIVPDVRTHSQTAKQIFISAERCGTARCAAQDRAAGLRLMQINSS